MIKIIDMIDDPNEVEQDVLEEIDPDLVSSPCSTSFLVRIVLHAGIETMILIDLFEE